MSGKIMGQVWDLDLPQRELLVLLAITDHADHDGCNMFPSIALLAWKTGYSQRTVIRILNSLVSSGVLIRHQRAGKSTIYDANLDAAPKKTDRPKTENKRKTHDKAMSYDKAMSVVTSLPVMKNTTHDTASRNVQDEPSIKQPSEREATSDEIPDHVPPHLRKVIAYPDLAPVASPDGGATKHQIVEAYCDAWSINVQSRRDAVHHMQGRYAEELAAFGATAEDVFEMCRAKRALGKQPAEYGLRLVQIDWPGWKTHAESNAKRGPVLETSEQKAAREAAEEEARVEWRKEQYS